MLSVVARATLVLAVSLCSFPAFAHPTVPPVDPWTREPGTVFPSPGFGPLESGRELREFGDLRAEQETIVSILTGHEEVEPGMRLSTRATPALRARTRAYLDTVFAELALAPQRHAYGSGENVFAVLPATEGSAGARETVVLGAHFDTVSGSPGANDNATGIALAIGVVAGLAAEPCRTRDLQLVFFDQEEIGLVGSAAFARYLRQAGARVHSVHTVDQMGWDQDGDRAFELELPTSALAALYQRAAATSDVMTYSTRTSSTNHQSFRSLGFPSIGLTEMYVHGDTTPHYHTSRDKFETVAFDYLESSTRVATNALRELVTEGCGGR